MRMNSLSVISHSPQVLPDEVINRLYAWHWPGNIRELRNVIEYLFVMKGESPSINIRHLPPCLLGIDNNQNGVTYPGICQTEQEAIEEKLRRFGTSVEGKRKAARDLGLSIVTLYRKIKRYGI